MIVTLCTGSACATDEATSACPISWWATMSRSFSDKTRLFFSSPATIRSIASSKSAVVTASFSLRAASRAASLTMFARSAPAKPGVRAAITPRSTSGASTTARACNLKIASRPRTSGLSTTTWRSKRPGRSSARSRTSGRFVAAMRITPFDESKPSISARSWFRVCSRSSWPPMNPVAPARDLPIASSSSMKMMHGALSFACSNRSRTRDLFEQAKDKAPCIIFIDELDAIGKSRAGATGFIGGHDEREQTLNQLLAEMDGFDSSKGVILMAATNRPEVLDLALLRPGRFDRQVVVDKPDIRGREAILRLHARNVVLAPSVDLGVIAARTPGFAGADLANIVNEAALLAARKEKDAVG